MSGRERASVKGNRVTPLEHRSARQVLPVLLVRQEPQEQLVQQRQEQLEQQQRVLVERPMRWRCFRNRQWFHSCCMEQLLAKQQRFRHNRNQRLELDHTMVLVRCRMLHRPSIEQPSLLGA